MDFLLYLSSADIFVFAQEWQSEVNYFPAISNTEQVGIFMNHRKKQFYQFEIDMLLFYIIVRWISMGFGLLFW